MLAYVDLFLFFKFLPNIPWDGFTVILLLMDNVGCFQFFDIECNEQCCPELFFFLFRAAPETYGGSQARRQIRATATGLYHSHTNVGSEPHL